MAHGVYMLSQFSALLLLVRQKQGIERGVGCSSWYMHGENVFCMNTYLPVWWTLTLPSTLRGSSKNVPHKSKMADGCTYKKIKCYISVMVWPIFMKFFTMTQIGPLVHQKYCSVQNFEYPRWWMATILKSESCNISKTVWPVLTKFCTMIHIDPLT